MSVQKPKPVCAASKRQDSAADKEALVPWDDIHEWWKTNKDIDSRIVEANAALRELQRSAVTKCELSNTAKQSVFKSVLNVSIITCLKHGYNSKSNVATSPVVLH